MTTEDVEDTKRYMAEKQVFQLFEVSRSDSSFYFIINMHCEVMKTDEIESDTLQLQFNRTMPLRTMLAFG